jgi:hypothetical protein
MSDHTPTTQEVMEQWREQWSYDHDENGKEPRDAQFHRWLAQHDAEVTKTERERIIELLKYEASEWLSHDGVCDCKIRGKEVQRLIGIIQEENE